MYSTKSPSARDQNYHFQTFPQTPPQSPGETPIYSHFTAAKPARGLFVEKKPRNSIRSPDRFIPSRNSSSRQNFQFSKSWDQLSPSERLLRNDRDSPNPFTSSRFCPNSGPTSLSVRRVSGSHQAGPTALPVYEAQADNNIYRVVGNITKIFNLMELTEF